MLAVPFVSIAIVVFLFVGAPHPIGPGGPEPEGFSAWIVPAIGVVGIAVGSFWMVRIYRADPEARPSSFRFRR